MRRWLLVTAATTALSLRQWRANKEDNVLGTELSAKCMWHQLAGQYTPPSP
jgi:hypothetical protein